MESTGTITIEVIERIRDTPAEGIEAFVDRYGARLLIFIRYKLGNKLKTKVDAEDVLQDFFTSLVESSDRFLQKVDERGVHRAAFRMIEGRIKDLYEHHFKTKKRDAGREIHERPAGGASKGFGFSQVAGATASLSQRIERQDEFKSLERILGGLEDDSRKLFVLKFVEECTNQQIAEEIGVSVSTVKREAQALVQTIHRVRKRMGA